MKKFTKILFFLLTLVAIVTAFTVVALAEEELTPHKVANGYGTFDSRDEGTRLSYDRNAWATVQLQDNGNKYMMTHDAPEGYYESLSTTSGSYENWTNPQMDVGTGVSNTYNIVDYPYFMIEFDIATLNGKYDGFSYAPRLYKNSSSLDFLASTKFSDISKLSKNYFEWSHFALVAEYKGEGQFTVYRYVNGSFVSSNNTNLSAKITSEAIAKTVAVKNMKFYPSQSSDLALDNMYFTFFPAGYASDADNIIDTIANYNFKNGEGYEFPYKYTVAKVGDTVYDDLNEAIAAGTESGEIVKLTENAKKTLVINKNVTIDTNIYDADGNPTGTFYTYTYETTQQMIPTETAEGSGIFSFARDPKAIDVIWDEACEGECDCFAEYGGHQLSADTVFVVGETPVYPTATPVYDIADDYSHKLFLGWSYTNDGTVDTIAALTEDDLANGAIKLYPVYKTRQYTVKSTTSGGVVSYYDGETLAASIGSIPGNSTIQLMADTITNQLNLPNKNLTLDLNGYSLSRQTTKVTNYSATLGENGEYVKGDLIGTESYSSATGDYLFYYGKLSASYSFTLTSSRPGATIGGMTVTVDRWICDGKVVKTENAAVTGAASLFSFYPVSGTVNMYGENITYYVANIIYGEHGGNGSETVNIDGGIFINMGAAAEGLFALRNGEKTTIRNATFYCNGKQLVRNAGGLSEKNNRNKNTEITFENCKIFDAELYTNATTDVYTFNNCIADISINASTTGTVIIGKNTVTTKDLVATYSVAQLADGLESEVISKKLYYNKLTKSQIVFDLETLTPTAEFTNNYTSKTFVYLAKGDDTAKATVTWKDPDGNVLAITEEISGLLAFAPKVPWGDGYRGVVNTAWVDSDGNAANLVIGDADSYEFTAVLPSKENAAFEAYLTDAMLNMVYYAHFGYTVFVPAVDGVTVTINGKEPSGTVLIYGKEYYYRTVSYVNSTNALHVESTPIGYTIDGKSYSATLTFNALLYAQLAMGDPNSTETEKEAVACLVRYIHESYKFVDADLTLDDATEAQFQNFYTNYRTPAAYTAEYPANSVHTVNEDAIDGLIESITFGTVDSRVTLIVTLTDEAVAAGYKVFFSGIGWGTESNKGGKIFYTDNRVLYRYLMSPTYSIWVVESDGTTAVVRDLDGDGTAETKAEVKYSMPTYITVMEEKGVNVDLIKSLYALGVKVLEVRETIY